MAALDTYVGTSGPAEGAEEVTPSDVNELTYVSRALYIGTTGDLTVKMYRGGNTVTFANVPVGLLPIEVRQVLSTGTTASDIVSLY